MTQQEKNIKSALEAAEAAREATNRAEDKLVEIHALGLRPGPKTQEAYQSLKDVELAAWRAYGHSIQSMPVGKAKRHRAYRCGTSGH